jgi:hypothetical protein
MIPKFKIFKKGVTENPVTIYQKIGEDFNEKFKREKYLFLGYSIIEL